MTGNKDAAGLLTIAQPAETSTTMEVEAPPIAFLGTSAGLTMARGAACNAAMQASPTRQSLYISAAPSPPQDGPIARATQLAIIPRHDELGPIRNSLLTTAARFLQSGIAREDALAEKIESISKLVTMIEGGMEPIWESEPQIVLQNTSVLPLFFSNMSTNERGALLASLNLSLLRQALATLLQRQQTLREKFGSTGVAFRMREIVAADVKLRRLSEGDKRAIEIFVTDPEFAAQAQTRAVALEFTAAPQGKGEKAKKSSTAREVNQPPKPEKAKAKAQARTQPAKDSGASTPEIRTVNIVGKVRLPKRINEILSLTGKYIGFEAQATRPNADEGEAEEGQAANSCLIIPRDRGDIWFHPTTKQIIHQLIADIAKRHGVPYAIVLAQAQSILQTQPVRSINLIADTDRWHTLLRYLIENQLIVKDADKGAGLTVMPLKWYQHQLLGAVTDSATYESRANAPIGRAMRNHLNAICRKHRLANIWDVAEIDVRNPVMYLMPKLHKTPISVRAIIPSFAWYTTRAAKWLHSQLFPMLTRFPWIITDRLTFINQIERLHAPYAGNTMLVTMDVTAMYTNIDLAKGISIIQEAVTTAFPQQGRFMLELLRWVLQNNYFLVGNQWFRQTKGAAMGGNVSGTFADLVVGVVEERIWREQPALKPGLYARYRDDTIAITTHAMRKTRKLAQIMSFETGLRFNIEQAGKQVHWLDITIYLGERFHKNRQLDFKPYIKPTNAQAFADYSTYKPETTKTSWITGENIRILRASRSEESFDHAIRQFKQKLLEANYPLSVICKRLKYPYNVRNLIMEPTTKGDMHYFSMQTTRDSHTQWNAIHGNLEPLLKSYNYSLTASRGKSIQDLANSTNKNVLNATGKSTEQCLGSPSNRRNVNECE